MSNVNEAVLEQNVRSFFSAMTTADLPDDLQQKVVLHAANDAAFAEEFLRLYAAAAVVGARNALMNEENDTDDASFAQLMRSKREAVKNTEKVMEVWRKLVDLCGGLDGTTAWFSKRYGA